MTKNRELLKEAIADAKTLKATAIANAKAALEEAFTPHIKNMFEEKLNAMDEEEALLETEEEENDLELESLLEEEAETEETEEEVETEEETEEEAETEEEEDFNIEDMTEDELKDFIETVIQDMAAAGELESTPTPDLETEPEEDFDLDGIGNEMEDDDEEVDVDQLISELKRARYQRKLNENRRSKLRKPLLKENRSVPTVKRPNRSNSLLNENAQLKKQLRESQGVISKLTSELKEINLLNAKLLYTNRIFKSTTLSESQKVKVLGAFDKASNVKEVKLVYESINGQLSKSNKKAIKERLGFASKTVAGPKVMNESKSLDIDPRMASRWKKLAGLE